MNVGTERSKEWPRVADRPSRDMSLTLRGIWRLAEAGPSEEKPRSQWALGEEKICDLWTVGAVSTSSSEQCLPRCGFGRTLPAPPQRSY